MEATRVQSPEKGRTTLEHTKVGEPPAISHSDKKKPADLKSKKIPTVGEIQEWLHKEMKANSNGMNSLPDMKPSNALLSGSLTDLQREQQQTQRKRGKSQIPKAEEAKSSSSSSNTNGPQSSGGASSSLRTPLKRKKGKSNDLSRVSTPRPCNFQTAASFYCKRKKISPQFLAKQLKVPLDKLRYYLEDKPLRHEHLIVDKKVYDYFSGAKDFDEICREIFIEKDVRSEPRNQGKSRIPNTGFNSLVKPSEKYHNKKKKGGIKANKLQKKFDGIKSKKLATGSITREDYLLIRRLYLRKWKLKREQSKQKKLLFDPMTCSEGFMFADEVNRLCNFFNFNAWRINNSMIYGEIYKTVLFRFENLIAALDKRFEAAINTSLLAVHDFLQLVEEATVSFTIFSVSLSIWHSSLAHELCAILFCLWRRILLGIYTLETACYKSALDTLRICSAQIAISSENNSDVGKMALEHKNAVDHWLRILKGP